MRSAHGSSAGGCGMGKGSTGCSTRRTPRSSRRSCDGSHPVAGRWRRRFRLRSGANADRSMSWRTTRRRRRCSSSRRSQWSLMSRPRSSRSTERPGWRARLRARGAGRRSRLGRLLVVRDDRTARRRSRLTRRRSPPHSPPAGGRFGAGFAIPPDSQPPPATGLCSRASCFCQVHPRRAHGTASRLARREPWPSHARTRPVTGR
jgi:hypothetical protein